MLSELAAILIRPPKRVPPDQWARENRVYPKTAGVPGPRDPWLTPYGVPFARAIHSGQYRRVVAVMASQMGKTDSYMDAIGARLDQRPAPILYVGPSKDFVSTQFEPRLNEMFDQAASLALKIDRRRKQTKTLKRVAGVRIRLAHAGSSTALKSDPASLALVDEYDEMLANIRGQGDPLGLVEARGETYAEFVTGVTSTPSLGLVDTYVDEASKLERWRCVEELDDLPSAIWRLWQDGTRHEWTWRCPHCRDWFIPRFKHLRWAEGASAAEARRTAYLACPASGCVIEDDERLRRQMNAEGRLTAPGQWVDEAGEVQGEPPDSPTWSMWVSGLASPFQSFGQRAEAYVTALNSGEADKVQTAVNARFGETFSPVQAGQAADWGKVRDAAAPYRFGEVPAAVLRVAAGVDVQKRSLYYVVRGFGARGRSWLLERGQIIGDTAGDEVWDELTLRLTTPFAGLHVEKAFVDSGFRPDKREAGDIHRVYQYCVETPWLAVPAKGRDRQASPVMTGLVELTSRGKKDARKLQIVHVHTDRFKSQVFAGMEAPEDAPGRWFVPHDIDEGYCRQVASETRTVTKSGQAVWVRRSRDNHYLDCEALAQAAGYMLGVHRIPEGAMREADAASTDMHPPRKPEAAPEAEIRKTEAEGAAEGAAAEAPSAPAAPIPVMPREAERPKRLSLAERMAARAAKLNGAG